MRLISKSTRISYAELERRLDDTLLCNSIWQADEELMDNLYSGQPYFCTEHENCTMDGDDCALEEIEVYQSYLISESDAKYIAKHTEEIIYYSPLLDLYVWQITHFGTIWDGVYLSFTEPIE